MSDNKNLHITSNSRPLRERVGLIVNGINAATAVTTVVAAEDAGVRQIWMSQPPNLPDVLTTFAAVASKTSSVNLGTSIVPTYPRHPLVLAQQALALHDIAPDRVRLGIGPSHSFIIEKMYGLQQSNPLSHLREYVEVLRMALWDGKVSHHGNFYNVEAELVRTAQIPLLISTLGKMSFHMAGKIADGALTWVCPIPYLLHTGIPTLRSSAVTVGRSAPPLIAHVPVILSDNRASILEAGHRYLDFYAKIPFYANMFSNAGFPIASEQVIPNVLIDNLVISGNETTIEKRLTELLGIGIDEIMMSLVPISGMNEDEQQAKLMHLVGQLGA
jgi:F420-dependent oxidoreductase-like protein